MFDGELFRRGRQGFDSYMAAVIQPKLWGKFNEAVGSANLINYGTLGATYNAPYTACDLAQAGPRGISAVMFNGTTSKVTIPAGAYADYANTTIGCLVKILGVGGSTGPRLWQWGVAGNEARGVLNSANQLQGRRAAATSASSQVTTGLMTGQWAWLFYRYADGGDRIVHILYGTEAGVAEQSYSASSAAIGAMTSMAGNVLVIGNESGSTRGYLGLIAQFFLTDRIVPDSELAVITQSTLAPEIIRQVQGVYARTVPTPNAGSRIRPLAVDPNVAGRVWADGYASHQLGYTDDHGATYTPKVACLGSSWQGLLFANSYLWGYSNGAAVKQSKLGRSPQPDAAGDGISWTVVFDMASPPAGITVGNNAQLRNSSVAVNGTTVMLAEYGTTVTGGPSIHRSLDSGATWATVKTFAGGRHIHCIKLINGSWWVMVGDDTYADAGLWSSSDNGATWTKRSLGTLYGVNMFADVINGTSVIVSEGDVATRQLGLIVFPDQDNAGSHALNPTQLIPVAYQCTTRTFTKLANGNAMFLGYGEVDAVGPFDTVWFTYPPYTNLYLCEALDATPNTFDIPGDPILDGPYIWIGVCRITPERYAGQ